ncbi:hypothetical protein NW765_004522 [Fusarium oxysporum]|nr:hypothetical protein NW765_004522 [Fusarium oxysporum]
MSRNMSLDVDYRREYDALEHALAEQAVGTRLCSDCQAANPIALLEGNIPQTFEDAIGFTKRLGERYIWIDALCIPQDEPGIKAQQISQMDQIYSSSICTIVSLESGVEGGLPGSSYKSSRNVDQYLEQLPGGLKVASPLMSLRLLMEGSAWETRGWTM